MGMNWKMVVISLVLGVPFGVVMFVAAILFFFVAIIAISYALNLLPLSTRYMISAWIWPMAAVLSIAFDLVVGAFAGAVTCFIAGRARLLSLPERVFSGLMPGLVTALLMSVPAFLVGDFLFGGGLCGLAITGAGQSCRSVPFGEVLLKSVVVAVIGFIVCVLLFAVPGAIAGVVVGKKFVRKEN